MKMIYQAGGDEATRIMIAIELHLWDMMTMNERKDWCKSGVVYDTIPGKQLYKAIMAA